MTAPNVIDMDPRPSVRPDSFHTLRLGFNQAFLNEDFDQAQRLCADAIPLCEGNEKLLMELAQFHMLLGDSDAAIHCFEMVLEISSPNHSAALKMAMLLRTRDEDGRYERFIQQRIDSYPNVKEYYQDYAAWLIDRDDTEALTNLLAKAEANGVEGLNRQLSADDTSQHMAPARPESGVYSDTDIMAMLGIFSGKENCYARQWAAEDGKHGYTPVYEPPVPNVIANHLAGNYTVGIYQLDSNSKVKWIVFDLDVEKSHEDDMHDPAFRKWMDAGFVKAVGDLRSLLAVHHITPNIEFSGYKGYHVWVLLEAKVSAAIARAFAQRLAAQLNLSGLPIHLDIFPKQSRLSQNNMGNLVKLPYGIHRRSGLGSFMVDEDYNPITLQEFIRSPAITSLDCLMSALSALDPGFSANTLRTGEIARPSSQPAGRDEFMLITELDPENDLQWLWLKKNCDALRKLDELASSTRRLNPEQVLALKYSVGYLNNGANVVNHILRKCAGLDPAELMRSPFKGKAISCAKMRRYLEGVIDPEKCVCDFSSMSALYDSPVLHLATMQSSPSQNADINDARLKDLITGYLELKRHSNELNARLVAREQDLIAAFGEAGVDSFSTPYGVLRIVRDGDTVRLTLELK